LKYNVFSVSLTLGIYVLNKVVGLMTHRIHYTSIHTIL